MALSFFRTIRCHELEVFADHFDGDESVGIGYGPEEVWAKTLEGEPFELTDLEIESLGIEATKIWYEQE